MISLKSKKSSKSSVIIKQLTLEERENIDFFAKYDKLVLKNYDIKNNDKTEINELREKIDSQFPNIFTKMRSIKLNDKEVIP